MMSESIFPSPISPFSLFSCSSRDLFCFLSAWGKLCEILRADFAPYLSYLMPSLLAAASMTPEVSLMDGQSPLFDSPSFFLVRLRLPSDESCVCWVETEDDEDDEEKAGQDWEQVNISGQQIGIKTSSLQQTAEAFGMLVIYASSESSASPSAPSLRRGLLGESADTA